MTSKYKFGSTAGKQVVLIISGNLSFLNWLTILPCLACFDDASLAWMFSKSSLFRRVADIQKTKKTGAVPRPHLGTVSVWDGVGGGVVAVAYVFT